MPDCAVVTVYGGVLLRLVWLDVRKDDVMFLSPFKQRLTNVSGAVVDADRPGLAAPLNDVVEASDNRSAGREKSTSIFKPSRLKSSSTFSSRNARPSASRSAMKSIDQVTFNLSSPARASGTSRFSRLRGVRHCHSGR